MVNNRSVPSVSTGLCGIPASCCMPCMRAAFGLPSLVVSIGQQTCTADNYRIVPYLAHHPLDTQWGGVAHG